MNYKVSEKRVLHGQHRASHKSGESALILGSSWKNNLNFVKDVPIIYVNFKITKLIFSEKKIGEIIFIPPLVLTTISGRPIALPW
jgi:hypothetical protein